MCSVEGFAINIALQGCQCFKERKQLLLGDATVMLSRHHVPTPKGNKPTLCDEHSTKTKLRSIAHQVKMGLPSIVSGRARHGAELRAVFNPAKPFWQAKVQSKGVFFFSNAVSGAVKLA